jgi:ABC-type branched-subunit amino acid transport system substrate-binding protein
MIAIAELTWNLSTPWLRRARAVLAASLLAGALAGCSGGNNVPAPDTGAQAPGDSGAILVPIPESERTKIGLILPLTGEFANTGQAMLNSAQLALFDATSSNIALEVRDDAGAPGPAAQAAQSALADGAQFILGPLFGRNVQAVRPVVQSKAVNLVSFSSDPTVAGDGAWVMGILPSLQVERIIGYSGRQGLKRFAALLPQSAYGQVVATSLKTAASRAGGEVVRIDYYDPNSLDASFAVGQLGQFIADGGQVDALLIPEGDQRLLGIVQSLPTFGIDPLQIRLLGSTAWESVGGAGEPLLAGAWYPAPDPQRIQNFATQKRNVYGSPPPRIAYLAYDAVLMAAALAAGPSGADFGATALTDPNGFYGVDGLFRLRPDGGVDRGLAILEVSSMGPQIREPPPQNFDNFIY